LKGPSGEREALDLLEHVAPSQAGVAGPFDGRVVRLWHGFSVRANVIVRHLGVGENSRSASRQPPSHSAGGYPRKISSIHKERW
jgi:hypothetical protein